jgi:hypothetical protein
MLSRTATGFNAGAVAERGRSDFATVTELELGDFAAELGAVPEGTLLPAPAAGLVVLPTVPGAALEPTFALEAGFAADLLAGLAVAFDVADPAGELGTEPVDGLDVDGAGLLAELAGGAGFGVCT